MAWTRLWVCVHCDLDLGDITLGQGYDIPLGHGQQLFTAKTLFYMYFVASLRNSFPTHR